MLPRWGYILSATLYCTVFQVKDTSVDQKEWFQICCQNINSGMIFLWSSFCICKMFLLLFIFCPYEKAGELEEHFYLPGNWGNNPFFPALFLPLIIFPPHRMLKHCFASHSWKVCFVEYRWDICWLAKSKVNQETCLPSTNGALEISVGKPNFYVNAIVSPYCLEHFCYIFGHSIMDSIKTSFVKLITVYKNVYA